MKQALEDLHYSTHSHTSSCYTETWSLVPGPCHSPLRSPEAGWWLVPGSPPVFRVSCLLHVSLRLASKKDRPRPAVCKIEKAVDFHQGLGLGVVSISSKKRTDWTRVMTTAAAGWQDTV